MEYFIGREKELAELNRCAKSRRSEFVIVYGRRRIGKTFLVCHFLGDNISFSYVGVRGLTAKQQLSNFALALHEYSKDKFVPSPTSWMEAFGMLRTLLAGQSGRKMVFIDEMPWMDNVKSDFVAALENFWNGWAASRDDICMIACGSSTSWLVDKITASQTLYTCARSRCMRPKNTLSRQVANGTVCKSRKATWLWEECLITGV